MCNGGIFDIISSALKEHGTMKRALAMLVSALACAAANADGVRVPSSESGAGGCADDSYLYWMLGPDVLSDASLGWKHAAVAVTDRLGSKVTGNYLNLADEGANGEQYVSHERLANGGTAAFVSPECFSDASRYAICYCIELLNDGYEAAGHSSTATSLQRQSGEDCGYIFTTTPVVFPPPEDPWSAGGLLSGPSPEPSTELLLLLGGLLVGIRRCDIQDFKGA